MTQPQPAKDYPSLELYAVVTRRAVTLPWTIHSNLQIVATVFPLDIIATCSLHHWSYYRWEEGFRSQTASCNIDTDRTVGERVRGYIRGTALDLPSSGAIRSLDRCFHMSAQARCFVIRSAGFSVPKTFLTCSFFALTADCSHR